MKTMVGNILVRINAEIETLGIAEIISLNDALHMINFIRPQFDELHNFIVSYKFESQNEEILFFKELKPQILSRLIYYNKAYRIESKCPNGSNEVVKRYLNDELNSLTYFFSHNLDFYQYYRSGATTYDQHYFVRGKIDIRLCTDSSQFDKDICFSTGYDYKVAKIIANEMLRIYLNQRLKMIEDPALFRGRKNSRNWTGQKNALVELGYALHASGDIDHGNIDIKEIMDTLGEAFNVDLGEYYRTYIALRGKKDRTAYLNSLIDRLTKRMDRDDAK